MKDSSLVQDDTSQADQNTREDFHNSKGDISD
jgi:hypothetical protein